MDSNNLCRILALCMSSNKTERSEGCNYLQEAKKHPGFAPCMLQISSDLSTSKEIQQNAAIQLKNYVKHFWKENTEINMTPDNKMLIKSNILSLLPTLSSKSNLKLYIQVIKKILKNENEWNEFIPIVQKFLKSSNQFEILCGVSAFYQMSKCNEFELEPKRGIYSTLFGLVCENFENLIDGLIQAVNIDLGHFAEDEAHYLSIKILYKIFKIFFSTIQMGIPNVFFDRTRIDKWINYIVYFIKINFPEQYSYLNRNPNTMDELETLRKSYLWKVKFVCYDIIFKFYQKYGDVTKIGKTEENLLNFTHYIEQNYSKFFFDIFFHVLSSSKDDYYVEEEIICLVYQFFQLILNRRDENLMPMLESNLEVIVKTYIVKGAMLGITDFDLLSNNIKQYIYKEYEKGLSFESRRVSVCEFVQKLCEFKKSIRGKKINGRREKRRPDYFDYVFDYLINTMTSIEDEIKKYNSQNTNNSNTTNNNLNYFILLKESCVKLIEKISCTLIEYNSDKIEGIIISFLANDIDKNYSLTLPVMRECAFSFILNFSSSISIQNPDLLRHIVSQIAANLTHDEKDLNVTIKCALTIPRILTTNSLIKELFRSNILNVFTVYLKLMQELDSDLLLKCLEELVTVYPKEVIDFSIDLTTELVEAFNRFIKDHEQNKFGIQYEDYNNNNIINNLDTNENNEEDDDFDDDEDATVVTACGIIKTLNKLLGVCLKENFDLFYQIEKLISPIIFWTLNSDNHNQHIFHEAIDVIFTITSSPLNLTDNAWLFYSEILKSLIHINNFGIVSEGVGLENIQEIIPIILNYIIKEPEKFIHVSDQNGINLMVKTLDYIPKLINLFKKNKDEVGCGCVIKILITILETFKETLNHFLKEILNFVIDQLKGAQVGMYKMMLFQTISVCYVYNPNLTNSIFEEMNVTQHIFELWVGMISTMRFDFEYRRTAMAFSSILLIDSSMLNPILKDNLSFILSKIVELLLKCCEIKDRKKIKDEAEVSDDNGSGEEEDDITYKSKSNNFKTQLKDFIDDDLNILDDDEDDDDYNEFENSFDQSSEKFRTRLDVQDECLYLQDILYIINLNNPGYHNYLMSLIQDDLKSQLGHLFEKAKMKQISR